MRPFAYERAADAAGAVALLGEAPQGTRYLAGGTNLVDLMKLEVETPPLLVDVRDLGTEIEESADGGLRIGAGVTNSALAADPRVRQRHPLLAEAAIALLERSEGARYLAGGTNLVDLMTVSYTHLTLPTNREV